MGDVRRSKIWRVWLKLPEEFLKFASLFANPKKDFPIA
jgi:hypothetical protein